jgi:SAM-dependent methyltransferase
VLRENGGEPTDGAGTGPSFDAECFAPLFAAEDRHFWFRARNEVIATLVSQVASGLGAKYSVLEIGCGTGNVLGALENVCSGNTVVGMDLFGEGLRFARRRVRCDLVRGDVCAPPFRRPFDIVGLFDVLEHLPNDMDVLERVRGLVAPRGALVLTVPAHPSLWSYFDEASHHCRRYTRNELAQKLEGAGFRLEYLSQYMATLFPMVWAGRRVAALKNRLAPQGSKSCRDMAADELRVVPVLNEFLHSLLSLEARFVARRRRLPFGTSLVAVARRANG